jgi:hypothetical protein
MLTAPAVALLARLPHPKEFDKALPEPDHTWDACNQWYDYVVPTAPVREACTRCSARKEHASIHK